MMIPPLNVLLLFMATSALAVIQETGLHRFCKHMSLDQPGGLSATDRIKDSYCEQTFPFGVESDAEAMQICRYFAPFNVKSASFTQSSVTCQWNTITTCVESTDILIKGRCFHVAGSTDYQHANTRCDRGSKLHRVKDAEEARWITILVDESSPIFVENSVTTTSKEMRYDDQVYDGQQFLPAGTENYPRALLMRMNDLSRVSAGLIIGVDKSVNLRVLCSTISREYQRAGGAADPTDSAARVRGLLLPEHMRPKETGGYAVVTTTNVYTLDKTSEINTMFMHDVCNRICEGCFAALPDMTNELKQHKSISLVPSRHTIIAGKVRKNDVCKAIVGVQAILRPKFESQPKSGVRAGVRKSSWQTKYPDNMCADTLRVAVVAESDGKLRDVPAITRHPIVCVKGHEPHTVKLSLCRDHSVLQHDGSCKCKTGMVDILETNNTERTNYVPGQMCVDEIACREEELKTLIMFVFDEPEGNTKASRRPPWDFLAAIRPHIPPQIRIGFQLYGHNIDGWDTWHYFIDFPWTQASLKQFIWDLPYTSFGTLTSKAVRVARGNMKTHKAQYGDQMQFMFILTDTLMNGDLHAALREVRQDGIKTFIVKTGGPYPGESNNDLESMVQNRDEYMDYRSNVAFLDQQWENLIQTICDKPKFEAYVRAAQNNE